MTNIFYITLAAFAVFFISLLFFGIKAIISSSKQMNGNKYNSANTIKNKKFSNKEISYISKKDLSILEERIRKLEMRNAALGNILAIYRKPIFKVQQSRICETLSTHHAVAKNEFINSEIKFTPESDYEFKNLKYERIK